MLVAGKGHEKYQEIGGRVAAVRRRGGGARGAGGAAPQVAGWVTSFRLTLGWVADGRRRRLALAVIHAGDRATSSSTPRLRGRAIFSWRCEGPRFDATRLCRRGVREGRGGAIVERGRPSPGVADADPVRGRRRSGRHRGRRHDEGAAGPGARGASRRAERGSWRLRGVRARQPPRKPSRSCSPRRFRVVKNKGNLNNHIGLPLSLLQLRDRPDVAVMELGMNHEGEISTLVAIAEPETRVWTNVGDAHIGFFASADAIADAKAEILERRGSRSPAGVQCRRSSRSWPGWRSFAGRTVTFGTSNAATVRAVDVEDAWRRRHARARRDARRGTRDPHAAARLRQSLESCSRPRPWRWSSDRRSTRSPTTAPQAQGRGSPWRWSFGSATASS